MYLVHKLIIVNIIFVCFYFQDDTSYATDPISTELNILTSDLKQEVLNQEVLPSDNIAFPSKATVIEDLDNIELIQIPTASISNSVILNDSSISNELINPIEPYADSPSLEMDNIRIINENTLNADANIQNLELIDCQIELMDQFSLTDHIELCNEEIQLQEDDDYLRVENICDMPDLFNIYHNSIMVEEDDPATDILIPDQNSVATKRRKTNGKSKAHAASLTGLATAVTKDHFANDSMDETEETRNESYSNWLDSVIERLNMTMDYSGNGSPNPLIFSIPHVYIYSLFNDSKKYEYPNEFTIFQMFFDYLRLRFTVGSRKRLPSHIKTFPSGKYKNLTMFCWKFTNVNLLKTIFKTDNVRNKYRKYLHFLKIIAKNKGFFLLTKFSDGIRN